MKQIFRALIFSLCLRTTLFAATNAEVFPILTYNQVPASVPALKRLQECGFTIAGFADPTNLDLCHAAGLQAIVNDPRAAGYNWTNLDLPAARRNIAQLIAETRSHPAVFGYKLRDEPTATMLPSLGQIAAIFRQAAPEKFPYINLWPNYAGTEKMGVTNYVDYLEQFASNCHPAIISYDNYSLMDDGTLDASFWSNLEQIRAVARRHHAQFWNTVLAAAHYAFREPTAADFRLQAYATLAYGGRGLAYFSYFAEGNAHGAPVDQFGHETATWPLLQNINLQILQLAPVILQLTNNDVCHTGIIPTGGHGLTATNFVNALGEGDFLIGEFTHRDGTRYALIVNKDLERAHRCAPEFRVTPKKVERISPFTGQPEDFLPRQTWLAPGEGALLKIEE